MSAIAVRRTQTLALPAMPHVQWYGEYDALGRLFLRFSCTICSDQTSKACEDFARSPRWASMYAANHPARPHAAP